MTDNPAVPDNGPDEQPKASARPRRERGPAFAAAEMPVSDLSEEIVKAIAKSADERVTCRRIVGNKYRCNWWAAAGMSGYDNPAMTGEMVTTHRVRRSELVRATKTNSGLLIESVPGPR